MKKFRFGLLVIVLALILPILFLGTDLVSSVKIFGPGGDAYWYLWVFKTFKTSIDSGIFWPRHVTSVFYPIGFDLSAGYESVLIYYASVVFQYFANITQTYNLLIYFGYILNILGGYQLVKQVSKQRLIAATFGTALAFAPQVIGRTNGHLPLIWIWPLLFYLAFLLKFVKSPKLSLAVPVGIFAALAVLVSWYFLTYLLIFSLVILASELIKNKRIELKKLKTVAINLVPAGVISIAIILLFAWPMFISRVAPNGFYGYPFKMGLGNLVLIKEYNLAVTEPFSISGMSSLSQYSPLPHSRGETVSFIGLYAIFLLILVLISNKVKKTRRSFIWLGLCAIFYFFALGIYLRVVPGEQVVGENKIRLPFYWLLFKIPIFNTMHAPGRFWMPAQISLILFLSLIPTYFKKRSRAIVIAICFLLIFYENSSYTFDRTELPSKPMETLDNTSAIFPLSVQDPDSLKIAVYYSKNVLSGYQTHTTFSSDEDLVMWNSIFQPLVNPDANLWKVLPDLDEPLEPSDTAFLAYHRFQLDGYYFRNQNLTPQGQKLKEYLQTIITPEKRGELEYYKITEGNLVQPTKTIFALENGFYTPEKDEHGKYRESRGEGKIIIYNPNKQTTLKNNIKISNGKNTKYFLNNQSINLEMNSAIPINAGFNELTVKSEGCEPAGEIRCRGFRIEKFDQLKTIFY